MVCLCLYSQCSTRKEQNQLKYPETKGGRESKKSHSRFRSHTTSIQNRICFKADTSQLIYLHTHFSSEESMTVSEEHARYRLTDGHPLAFKASKYILTLLNVCFSSKLSNATLQFDCYSEQADPSPDMAM